MKPNKKHKNKQVFKIENSVIKKMEKTIDEETQYKIDDINIQLMALFPMVIARLEFLEQNNYFFGSIKQYMNNASKKLDNFIIDVFRNQRKEDSLEASNKIMVMIERAEYALENRMLLTVDERRERTEKILSRYLIKPIVGKVMEELEDTNSFNF